MAFVPDKIFGRDNNPVTGEFDVENKGVSPDIEVEFDPALWRQGHDPQLQKGVCGA
jgi:tricorn protease